MRNDDLLPLQYLARDSYQLRPMPLKSVDKEHVHLARGHIELALYLEELGIERLALGERQRATFILMRSHNILEYALGPDHEDVIRVLGRLQDLCYLWGSTSY